MERSAWKSLLDFRSIESYPRLMCPYCFHESLVLDKDTIDFRSQENQERKHKELSDTYRAVGDTYKDNKILGILFGVAAGFDALTWEYAKFICFFVCDNCNESVCAVGTTKDATQFTKASGNTGLYPQIKVEYFSPPIPYFPVPDKVPDSVRHELLQSFNHYHSDVASSGAKLRKSIEMLCADLGYTARDLHNKIQSLKEKYPDEGRCLEALKLLGNEATHSDGVSEDDLLDAYEIYEYVLHIYDRVNRKDRVSELSLNLREKFEK